MVRNDKISRSMKTNNDNQRMLFDGKRARVNVERQFAQWDSPAGKQFPSPADWKDKQLSNDISNCQRRLRPVSTVTPKGGRLGLFEVEAGCQTDASAWSRGQTYITQTKELIDTRENENKAYGEEPGSKGCKGVNNKEIFPEC
jgi:hypothetical protein